METVILEEGALWVSGQRVDAPAPRGELMGQVRAWKQALEAVPQLPRGPVVGWLPDAWVHAAILEIPKGTDAQSCLLLQAYGLWRHGAKEESEWGAFWPSKENLHTYRGVGAFVSVALAQALVDIFSLVGMQLVWLGPACLRQEAYPPQALDALPSHQNLLGFMHMMNDENPQRPRGYAFSLIALGLIGAGLAWGNIQGSRRLAVDHEHLIQTYSLLARIKILELEWDQRQKEYEAWRQWRTRYATLPGSLSALETLKQAYPSLRIESLNWDLDGEPLSFTASFWAPGASMSFLQAQAQLCIEALEPALGTSFSTHLEPQRDGSLHLSAQAITPP